MTKLPTNITRFPFPTDFPLTFFSCPTNYTQSSTKNQKIIPREAFGLPENLGKTSDRACCTDTREDPKAYPFALFVIIPNECDVIYGQLDKKEKSQYVTAPKKPVDDAIFLSVSGV